MEKITQRKIIKNGGLEQGLLEMAEDCGCISAEDKTRLAYLKTLPQNRVEILSVNEFQGVNNE